KARIYLQGYTESEVVSESFTIIQKAADPTIAPLSGTTANDNLAVTITNNTPNAVVRYTLNGAAPTSYSTIYDGPIQLTDGTYTVKARAYLTGANPSEIVTALYTIYDTSILISPPVVEPVSGNFNGPLTVTMMTDVEVDLIFYNLDATDPAAPPIGKTVYPYHGPFQLFGDDTYYVRARAYVDGVGNSDMTFGTLTVVTPTLGAVQTPTISPPGGQFTNTVAVQIDAPDFNPPFKIRKLFYSTDGTDPELNFDTAGAGIPKNLNISSPTTVKAIAGQAGYDNSQIASAEFTFICETPDIAPAGGVFTDTVEVALSTGTANSAITYTTDGSEPSLTDNEYSTPFTLNVGVHTIKAKCFKDDYLESETAVAVLPVLPTPVAPVILTQPSGQTVDAGTPVTLTVEAAGIPDPSYQWTKDGIPIAGETETDLQIPAAALSNAGDYQVIVSNQAGEVLSQQANLAVNAVNVELSIQKVAHASSITAGERITYTLTMVNNASVPVMAQIVENLSPATAVSSLSDNLGACGEIVNGVATCTTSLAANTSTQLTIYLDTDENFTGVLTNNATINGTDGFVNVNSDNSSGPVTVNITPGGGSQSGSLFLPLVLQAASPSQSMLPAER
ncbi:MAG: chitobiase/beta-hexosaminidase C-terminal domain-containing protein, partial [Anaerolineales bacterium]|nr:chitobiase/beta-hexosaminidase C-terminal domain-containing protein [Anaerolineales bacterium]